MMRAIEVELWFGRAGGAPRALAMGLALWAAAVAALGAAGLFATLPLPLFGLLVGVATAVPIAFYYRHAPFRAALTAVPMRWLTAFHVWRVPAALVFFAYGAAGALPDVFVRNAAWGDLTAGLLAAVVVVLPFARARYLGFHLFGLADFALAVGTGLAFSLLQVPLMATIATWPLVMIPMFGVCVSGAGHVVAIDRLLRDRRLRARLQAPSAA